MHEPPSDALLHRLRAGDPREAWSVFLDLYSPLISGTVRQFERTEDAVADCYLFVCEQLSRDGFRRLLRFRPDGPASFPTWLRTVVRNLCLDRHRQEYGRHRAFESIARLPAADQEVFNLVFVDCLPVEDAYLSMKARTEGLTAGGFNESLARVQRALTPRQRWLLAVRRGRELRDPDRRDDEILLGMPAESPNPESWAALQEARSALHHALARLSPRERLLVKLRFGRDLTLEQIARLLRLDNAQSADRRIKEALEKLRREMTAGSPPTEK